MFVSDLKLEVEKPIIHCDNMKAILREILSPVQNIPSLVFGTRLYQKLMSMMSWGHRSFFLRILELICLYKSYEMQTMFILI